ncbi:GHMP family kinase ATP-binding protein [Tessaracoccus antarcticus]|uniref:Galactokinase n=1 Tax=Tessaracoccus antarcticus TaxID=2479848 RepID=A0A3M0G775_9ACTN|nr:galactokinase family protein [Tessaracoccus antarcticus]RMB58212.1 galactokinase [Tessaracoccus antarcticus]
MTRWFVPGRLEVFGKHTDYAGGNSLLAAVDRGVTIDLSDADAHTTASTTASSGDVVLRNGETPDLPSGHWGGYVSAVVERLRLNFGEIRPVRLHVDSDLPLASGMSSSSALVVALALSLIDHNGLRDTPQWRENIHNDIDLAGYMACFENGMTFGTLDGVRGVGTFGGSEDHTAMLCCKADHLTQFRFCPIVEGESVLVPDDLSFVVAVSGLLAEKTGAALASYNQASIRTREIVAAWNDATGREDVTIADALASDEDASEGLRAVVGHSPELTSRLRAFLTESEDLIPAATAALRTGDLETFGHLSDLSQKNADKQLGNQVPETNRLQALARELGAHGASSFGAGFGGSVWALTGTSDAEAFGEEWLARYTSEYPGVQGRASVLVTRSGGPARRL